jgi:hypothetical protein
MMIIEAISHDTEYLHFANCFAIASLDERCYLLDRSVLVQYRRTLGSKMAEMWRNVLATCILTNSLNYSIKR